MWTSRASSNTSKQGRFLRYRVRNWGRGGIRASRSGRRVPNHECQKSLLGSGVGLVIRHRDNKNTHRKNGWPGSHGKSIDSRGRRGLPAWSSGMHPTNITTQVRQAADFGFPRVCVWHLCLSMLGKIGSILDSRRIRSALEYGFRLSGVSVRRSGVRSIELRE